MSTNLFRCVEWSDIVRLTIVYNIFNIWNYKSFNSHSVLYRIAPSLYLVYSITLASIF